VRRAIAVLGLVAALGALALIVAGSARPTPSSARAASSASSPPAAPAHPAPGPPAPAAAAALPSFSGIAQNALRSVVTITSTEVVRGTSRGQGGNPFGGGGEDPFEFFFGPGRGQSPRERRQVAGGSGFVITADGEILTNNHVVAGAEKVTVKLRDRRVFTARTLGTDPVTDVALIKIDAGAPLEVLPLGDSDALQVGDWVVAVGNPLMFEGTVTVGVVSGKGRRGLSDNAEAASFENFIQTDAAINFGNSGGPLINTAGQVVGINTAMIQPAQNIGFAVAINTARGIIPQLKSKGKVVRGMLGIQITDVSQDIMQAFHLPSMDGAFVEDVTPNGPAARAGVQHGDTIVSVDGRPVKEPNDLIGYVSSLEPGRPVRLGVVRDGRTQTLTATLAERPGQSAAETSASPAEARGARGRLGIQVAELSGDVRQQLGVPAGISGVVVADVAPDSPLADQGVSAGDVITEINGVPVRNAAELRAELANVGKGQYARLYVRRFQPQEASRFVVVRLD
jgi:serine protease Do